MFRAGRENRNPVQFVCLGEALQGDFLAPALHWGQQFWHDFVVVFLVACIPLILIILAPNALGL